MKVVGIACSPRPKGNSTTLLNACLDALSQQGADIQLFKLHKMKISLCTGCESCSKTGRCVFNDDLPLLFSALKNADKVVFAAPIFGMGINALGKVLVDRTQVFWAQKYVLKTLNYVSMKDGYFISTAGTTITGVFDCAKKTVDYFYYMTGYKMVDSLLINPVDKPGEIEENSDAMVKATRLVSL